MTKHFFSALGAALLLGCGGVESPPGGERLSPFATVEQAMDVPGTHGYEIELPIWNFSYVPPEWETYNPETVGWLIRNRSGASAATMDWRGGNALYGVMNSHLPYLEVVIGPGSGHQVIGHITGFLNNIQPGLVRGSVEMEMGPGGIRPEVNDDFVLALQVFNGTSWQDIATRSLRRDVFFYGEVAATVQPNVQVRFEIRMKRLPGENQYTAVTTARMFGAQCYPDFSNPGSCL